MDRDYASSRHLKIVTAVVSSHADDKWSIWKEKIVGGSVVECLVSAVECRLSGVECQLQYLDMTGLCEWLQASSLSPSQRLV